MVSKNAPLCVLFIAPFLFACASGENLKALYWKSNPSVGIIYTTERAPSPEQKGELAEFGGLGSGVLISEDGKMITAAHVVQTADRVLVEFPGGERVMARVVASEPYADLALLQLVKMPKTATPAVLGDSDRVAIGDRVYIIGAPYGIAHVFTTGHISARHQPNRVVRNFVLGEFFQTDAAINRGNSGGPMFNLKGEVIGIVSSQLSVSGGFEGIGFAATANTARKVLLEEPSPWSGVEGILLTGDIAKLFNLPQPEGMLVERVAVGSMAHNAKVQGGTISATILDQPVLLGGDIVLSIQGITVTDELETREKIKKAVNQVPLGREIKITVFREGKKVELFTTRS